MCRTRQSHIAWDAKIPDSSVKLWLSVCCWDGRAGKHLRYNVHGSTERVKGVLCNQRHQGEEGARVIDEKEPEVYTGKPTCWK